MALVVLAIPGVPYLMKAMGLADFPKSRLGGILAVTPFAVAAFLSHKLANVRACSVWQQVLATCCGLVLGIWSALELSGKL